MSGMTTTAPHDPSRAKTAIEQALASSQTADAVRFAVLIGSRATGRAHADSDWDIAIEWAKQDDGFAHLGRIETLRHEIARALDTSAERIDLIDLSNANLAMRATVANDGIPLIGGDSLAWHRFLQRTWREIEDFYWDRRHVA